MTREEKIIEAGIEYTMQNSPVCIGGDNFYEQARMFNRNRSFEAGAKWADDNPLQDVVNLNDIWHDASEYPSKVGAILYQTTLGQFRTVCNDKSSEGAWKVFAIDYDVSRWTYISELLPKGGEE